ncbi:molybdopterin guanine dinucleotide-containing S/N-oxide reductase [uncultured Tateyamaria sp.]|uniref:molybdopterin guanine dinucleotide-containing S/N-oxide reductase n=1 Tax=uncultured Tateyamaria sp. TaxID=455651 RepID=UPI0026025639|nr:molybdopterin guanine dinucleotide-containing S/N-oxide reductase [uncultured Tateyamaria sp.]
MADLPLTANHWGTYRVETKDGKVTALKGFEQDDDPSPIGFSAPEVQTGPLRVDQPMVRKSWLDDGPGVATDRRGAEPFMAVSWDRAEALVADELNRVRHRFGNEAIYAGSYGWASAGRFHHAQSQIHRFLNCIGGYTKSLNTYSFAAAEVIMPHVLGAFWEHLINTTSWASVARNTELFVAFGGVPVKNGQINPGGIGNHGQKVGVREAAAQGVEFVNVSPLRSDMMLETGAEWLAARPSTDVALMLGLAHTLYVERLHDAAFLAKFTVGFDRFLPYLLGQSDGTPKSAAWAAHICGLAEQRILSLARRMAGKRTMISVSWSLTRQDHGEQPVWMGIVLAAMLGQIGLPGGGFGFGYSATNSIGLHYTSMPGASLPQGSNAVQDFIPVARVSDMLLNSCAPFDYNGQRRTYPDIRLVYWAGGNPFHHHQDINRMLKAWRKPETIIVHELVWNSMSKHADIVLPCTTPLERNDIAMSSRDPYAIYMSRVTDPEGQARNDHDIFQGIARRMGVEDAFTGGWDEAEWLRWIYDRTKQTVSGSGIAMPSYDDFKQKRFFKLPAPNPPTVFLSSFRDDPVAAPLGTPSGKIEIFSEEIEGYGYEDCPGHPFWMEPAEWLGKEDTGTALHLISNQPVAKLHSQFDHASQSRALKIDEREPVTMHPQDAADREIAEGDLVRLYNSRGACLAVAVIDDRVRPGVIQMSTGAWFDPAVPAEPGSLCKHGNPNMLTLDKGTSSLAQGPIAHSCLVDIERFEGDPPQVTAFQPPEILRPET